MVQKTICTAKVSTGIVSWRAYCSISVCISILQMERLGAIIMAKWMCGGIEWNERCHIEFALKDGIIIRAETEDCDGDFGYWCVWEDSTLVAYGEISAGSSLWENGYGPQLQAERVICYGATKVDLRSAADYLKKNPDAPIAWAAARELRASRARVRHLIGQN